MGTTPKRSTIPKASIVPGSNARGDRGRSKTGPKMKIEPLMT
jgi:hypothetical protein